MSEETFLGDILRAAIGEEKPLTVSKFDKIDESTLKAIGRTAGRSRIDAVIVTRAIVDCSTKEAMAFVDACRLFVDNMEQHREEELKRLKDF